MTELLAAAVLFIAALFGGRFWGSKSQKKKQIEREAEATRKTEEAYDAIEKRDSLPADVIARLRDGSY